MEADTRTRDTGNLLTSAEEAVRALENRPSVSIRARLSIGFVAWFVVSLGLAIASIVTISHIQKKLSFTVAADRFGFEIQQARRFEKDYFLYQTNLIDAVHHAGNADEILERERENITAVMGESQYELMRDRLRQYEHLLSVLQDFEHREEPVPHAAYDEVEEGLREYGAEMVTVAEELVARERASVDAMLAISQRIPIGFLVALILLIASLAIFVAKQMLDPLNRMMEAAGRIAVGDFTPIWPQRKYHDEFSKLALAMNRMMFQLAKRQDVLVKTHRLQAVGTLTAGVAHELNNPMNNIMLSAASLSDEYDDLTDEERLEIADDLVGESERAQKIVKNLLDFARESDMESNALRTEDIIAETLRLAGNQIRLSNVRIKGELDPDLPPVFGDRQQLTQVFLNMVLNALDAMPEGGELDISVKNTRDRDFVHVVFTDTGVGIPEHQVRRIFDPFFSTKPQAKGTGLGLSVSLGIIRQHGGDISVSSAENVGTQFTITLPTARVPATMNR